MGVIGCMDVDVGCGVLVVMFDVVLFVVDVVVDIFVLFVVGCGVVGIGVGVGVMLVVVVGLLMLCFCNFISM